MPLGKRFAVMKSEWLDSCKKCVQAQLQSEPGMS